MTMRGLQVYKCLVCDSVVEVLDACGVELVCCGPPMELMPEQSASIGRGRHGLQISRTAGSVHVTVGCPRHPSGRHDRIAWIELLADGMVRRRLLAAGERPEATFATTARDMTIRYYCTSHGLWSWSQPPAAGAAQQVRAHAAAVP